MGPQQERQITEAKLSQIEPGIRAFIVVRIVRLWKTMLPPHNEFISLDFVAFDDQKNAMHGTIPSKYSDELEYQLIEGRVYKIKMFQVTKRKQSHNALPMEKMLYLNSTTEIEEINNDIDGYPHYYFQFATMEDIVHRTDHEYFMTDVIGLLTSVTPISIVQISPKQFNTNVVGQASTQNLNASKWDIFIKLLSGDILRISIWENFLHQLDVENLLQQTNKPVIVVAGTTVNPTWGRNTFQHLQPAKFT